MSLAIPDSLDMGIGGIPRKQMTDLVQEFWELKAFTQV